MRRTFGIDATPVVTGEYGLRPTIMIIDLIPGAMPQATVTQGLRPSCTTTSSGRVVGSSKPYLESFYLRLP